MNRMRILSRIQLYYLILLSVLTLSSCSELHLTAQFAAPDKRVPILRVNRDDKDEIWEFQGNYYVKQPVDYAHREVNIIVFDGIKGTESPYRFTDIEEGEHYYFPLTNKEIKSKLPEKHKRHRQKQSSRELAVVPVAETRPEEWKFVCKSERIIPKSTGIGLKYGHSGDYYVRVLPSRSSSRGLWRSLFVPPAYALDFTYNSIQHVCRVTMFTGINVLGMLAVHSFFIDCYSIPWPLPDMG